MRAVSVAHVVAMCMRGDADCVAASAALAIAHGRLGIVCAGAGSPVGHECVRHMRGVGRLGIEGHVGQGVVLRWQIEIMRR